MNNYEMNNIDINQLNIHTEDIFDILSLKIETDSSYDFWYNFGQTASEQDFWGAWFLVNQTLPNVDVNSKYSHFHYTRITKKCRLLYYLFCGALRMNRLNICDECVVDLKSVSKYNRISSNIYYYATTNRARSFVRNIIDKEEINNLNWYTTNTIIGKCQSQPLKKIQKNIDRIKNAIILKNCLTASVENTDGNVFEYIFKIIEDKYNSFRFEEDGDEDLINIIVKALEDGNGKVVDHLINKIYIQNKDDYFWIHDNYPKLREFIKNKNNLYQKMLSHHSRDGMVYVPRDMYSIIVEKMLFP